MSGMNSDQLQRSTMRIYMSLMDQFNPSLQRLVALGNNYIQAFQALTATSEAYFSALGKMGEQAIQAMSSHVIGDILIQIAASQRKLTSELEGVFHWFHNEVLLEMESNIRLDKTYISDSMRRYEIEVRNQLRRGGSQETSDYVQFLRESQRGALKEQERRYRFLAEKHCGLTQSIVYSMNKTGNTLQQRVENWKEQVNQTRTPHSRTTSRPEDTMADDHGRAFSEMSLGRAPSRAPSPQLTRSRSSSIGESLSGGRMMQALVSYPASSNPTLLSFAKGETINVLVPEPRNGWLYGRSESSTRQGWFPAAYVAPVDDILGPRGFSGSTLKNSTSMSNLRDQPASSRSSAPPPPPPPPPPPTSKSSSSQPVTPTSSEIKRKDQHASRPELFPRGTNPFATVKLKPTNTNDKSAPRLY